MCVVCLHVCVYVFSCLCACIWACMLYVEEQAKHLFCLCVCMCVCVTYGGADEFFSMYICVFVWYMYMCLSLCVSVCARVLWYGGAGQDSAMYICVFVFVCVCVCVCVCIYESVHLCKYMYMCAIWDIMESYNLKKNQDSERTQDVLYSLHDLILVSVCMCVCACVCICISVSSDKKPLKNWNILCGLRRLQVCR